MYRLPTEMVAGVAPVVRVSVAGSVTLLLSKTTVSVAAGTVPLNQFPAEFQAVPLALFQVSCARADGLDNRAAEETTTRLEMNFFMRIPLLGLEQRLVWITLPQERPIRALVPCKDVIAFKKPNRDTKKSLVHY
jgi:hypothetical protein